MVFLPTWSVQILAEVYLFFPLCWNAYYGSCVSEEDVSHWDSASTMHLYQEDFCLESALLISQTMK